MELSADCRGPGRRNVRKLLLYLAGSRDNYRKLRDFNVYSTNMQVNCSTSSYVYLSIVVLFLLASYKRSEFFSLSTTNNVTFHEL